MMKLKIETAERKRILPDDLFKVGTISPRDVEKYTGLRPQTLSKMRMQKRGPQFTRMGRKIRYPVKLLDEWMQNQCGLAGEGK